MGFLKYAVVVLLTAIALKVLPNFSPKLAVNMGGRVEPGFERAAEIFRAQMEKQPDKGIAFSAYYKGRPVVDLWGGYANPEIENPWKENTMSIFFSTTKAVAAICVAMLVDRGLLDYDKRVSQYWPDFAQNGKDKITVKHLVSHQAGLPLIATPINVTVLRNHKELGKILAQEKPMWEPGTAYGYHAFTYGFYVSQLISHADPKGRTVGQFFNEELRKQYDIDFFIGLPLSESYRVARHYALSVPQAIARYILDLNWEYSKFFLMSVLFPSQISGKIFENPPDYMKMPRWNIPEYQEIEQAAALGIGTARSLAKLFGILANGGKHGDRQLLSTKRIEQFQKVVVSGLEGRVNKLETPHWSVGLMVTQNPEGQTTFEHAGFGGQMAMSDPHKKLGFAYVSNMNGIYDRGNDPIYLALKAAVYDRVKQLK